jgi:hypothetical protein
MSMTQKENALKILHHLFHPKFKEMETPKLNSERKDSLSTSL